MLDNQIVQKSSDVNETHLGACEVPSQDKSKIYFDPQQAIADFDADAQVSVTPAPIVDIRLASYIKNARVLMKHGEYSLALNILRQACNRDSRHPLTLDLLATCLETTSRHQEALIARRALVGIDYGFANLFKYATSLYKLGKDQEALDKYYEALAVLKEENESLFETYKNMGNIFVRQGDFDAAEEYYNKAYTMNPKSDVLLVNLGTLEVQRNDFDKSLYCFRNAVAINPQNDKAWVGLAMVHNHFGDSELAWANIESAVDINPKNRTAVHLAANWGVRDGRTQKAIEFLQSYLGSVEEDEDMSLVLINLFCTLGHVDKALLEMERVLLWNPRHVEVRSLKKKILDSQKVA